nr:bifunctional phosphoribosyl-AMP cyclohydrolase/phosphoribosyl-ATP diphosphatase HisIE [Maliibacterium massiliense]
MLKPIAQQDIANLVWNEAGLIPAVAQDVETGAVLMLAYVNEEALRKSVETGYAHYYSRSRQQLWKKGETSGHLQRLRAVYYDCDGDALLYKVAQTGAACHTGQYTCFHNLLCQGEADKTTARSCRVLQEVFDTITDRRNHPVEGSYTNYLFRKGVDKICKKIGEESSEVIIAAKNDVPAEIRLEAADLLYHLMVLLVDRGMTLEDVYAELEGRVGKGHEKTYK